MSKTGRGARIVFTFPDGDAVAMPLEEVRYRVASLLHKLADDGDEVARAALEREYAAEAQRLVADVRRRVGSRKGGRGKAGDIKNLRSRWEAARPECRSDKEADALIAEQTGKSFAAVQRQRLRHEKARGRWRRKKSTDNR